VFSLKKSLTEFLRQSQKFSLGFLEREVKHIS